MGKEESTVKNELQWRRDLHPSIITYFIKPDNDFMDDCIKVVTVEW
ncbi:MAG: hypothetical protein ACUVQ5_03775 [Candidatus Methanomethylicaceae archaeon]